MSAPTLGPPTILWLSGPFWFDQSPCPCRVSGSWVMTTTTKKINQEETFSVTWPMNLSWHLMHRSKEAPVEVGVVRVLHWANTWTTNGFFSMIQRRQLARRVPELCREISFVSWKLLLPCLIFKSCICLCFDCVLWSKRCGITYRVGETGVNN